MSDCIFCKIAAGEIPVQKTYEDEHIIAFPDIHPKKPGHTLVVPKAHYRWFEEMPDDAGDHLFRAAKLIALDLKKKYQAYYVQLSIVGKDVPHVHVHLVPHQGDTELASAL